MSEDFIFLILVVIMVLLVIIYPLWVLVKFLAVWLYWRFARWGANRFYKSPYDKERLDDD